MTYRLTGNLFMPTRNILVPSRSLRDNRGFISPALLGVISIRRSSSAWTPQNLGGDLKFWIKSDTGITKSGNDVTEWADQSGNGRDLDSVSANEPQYNSSGGPNSLPSVDFTAASENYIKNSSTFTKQDPPYTIGLVAKWIDGSANQFAFDALSSSNRVYVFRADATGYNGFSAGSVIYGSSDIAGAWCYIIVEIAAVASNSLMRVNGAAYSNGDAGSNGVEGLNVGARYAINQYMNGSIAELLITAGVDATAIRGKLETYFAARYAL